MKAWMFSLIGLVMFLALPQQTFAESETAASLQKLTDLANHIYQAISNNQSETAKNYLTTFKNTWESIETSDDNLSPVAVRTIMAQEEQLKQALTLNFSEEEINNSSVEFRLTVDALANPEHPLWMGMKDKILSAFNKLEKDVQAGDDHAFQLDLNQFLAVYRMVYPSITINVKSDKVKELDAKINHIINNRMTIVQDKTSHISHLKETYDDLNALFGGTEVASGFVHHPGLVNPILIIGGLVIFTLLYVAWRKYKGEETNAHMTVTK